VAKEEQEEEVVSRLHGRCNDADQGDEADMLPGGTRFTRDTHGGQRRSNETYKKGITTLKLTL
jgi:hypothetical protein